jgi:hypothetical protein
METIRGIPNKYLYAACLAMAFVLFWAGGTAFDQSPFYGGLFIVMATLLFFASVYVGKQDRGIE